MAIHDNFLIIIFLAGMVVLLTLISYKKDIISSVDVRTVIGRVKTIKEEEEDSHDDENDGLRYSDTMIMQQHHYLKNNNSNNDDDDEKIRLLLNKEIGRMVNITGESRLSSPIVIEKYRLIFFNVPKVASTSFKLLFHEMEDIDTAYLGEPHDKWHVLHDPRLNHLKYFHDVLVPSPRDNNDNDGEDDDGKFVYYYYGNDNNKTIIPATDIFISDEWTKAIFVRDPYERLLSAYINKGVNLNFTLVRNACCNPRKGQGPSSCMRNGHQKFADFVHLMKRSCLYENGHWKPQSLRVPSSMWPYINFVGYMVDDRFEHDMDALMDRVGYYKYNKTKTSSSSSSSSNSNNTSNDGGGGQHHRTDSKQKMMDAYTQELYDLVSELYKEDFNNPYLDLKRRGEKKKMKNS